jgi:hypothetical protein
MLIQQVRRKQQALSSVKKIQQHNDAISMNAVVTSHQLVCLYSPAGEEGEPPRRALLADWWTSKCCEFYIRF